MARKIEVEVVGDSRNLERTFKRVGDQGNKLQHSLRGVGKASAIAIGTGVGIGLVGVAFAAKSAWQELVQAQKAAAQTNAVIKSTGGVANVSAKQVRDLSSSLLAKTGIDDEVIQAGENMLLTFRNIRNEIGKDNDIFNQATKIGLDMSTALQGAGFEGGSLQTTMIRLGKALNDPVQGMTALRRVGVTFDKSQQTTIKRLEETGHHLEAQKLILRELRAEFGGSAEAYGKTLPGRLMILRESLKNAGATILGYLVPAMETGMGVLGRFGDFIAKIAAAPNLGSAFKTAGRGILSIAGEIRRSLDKALFGSTETIQGGPTGYITRVRKGLLDQDWAGIGSEVAAGIGAGLTFTADEFNPLLGSMLAWVTSHTTQIADIGAEVAIRMALAVTDPAFWMHHMDLLAAVIVIGFSRGFGRVAERFGGVLVGRLSPVFRTRAAELASSFALEFERLPGLIGRPLEAAGVALGRSVAAIWSEVSRGASGEAGRLSNFLVRSLRLAAVVTAFRLGLEVMRNLWHLFTDWIHEQALQTVLLIVEPFSHLPRQLGGWARDVKDSMNAQLDAIHAGSFARRMEGAADRVAATAPRIAQARRAAAALARALESIPSDTTIRFVVRTLEFTPGTSPRGGAFQGGGHRAGGRINMGSGRADDVPAWLARDEFVVTPGGERMLEGMTFPGVLNYLERRQPPAFAAGGRVGHAGKRIEFDRLYKMPVPAGIGGAVSTHGLVPQVIHALGWARSHGWHGSVTSGFRSYAEQSRLYARYLAGGPLAARPGTSSHERGQAVDVTDYGMFGATMSTAPGGARLYNYLGAADPVHYSVTGYRAGGRPRPHIGQRAKRIARTLPRRHHGIGRRPGRGHRGYGLPPYTGPSPPEDVGGDIPAFTDLPLDIQEAIADADLTDPTDDDIAAYRRAAAYYQELLANPAITQAQRIDVKRSLKGVRDTLSSLMGTDRATAPDQDVQAQLVQANARAAASSREAALASAFVSTGVFGSTAGLGSGGGGATPTVVFASLIPDAEQIRRATEAIASGANGQGYIPSSNADLGGI